MMKQFTICILLLMAGGVCFAQSRSLKLLGSTDSVLKVPESIVWDPVTQYFYFTNVDGSPSQKDGIGSVGRMRRDGKGLEVEWVTGLNAPKGTGIYNGKLYVADIDQVDIIDIATGKLEQKMYLPDAKGLNDITTDTRGNVFVSDKQGKKIYRIFNGDNEIYLSGLSQPNGLLAMEDKLYLLDSGALYKTDDTKQLTKIADSMFVSTDGLVSAGKNEFIVSCWDGMIYYIHANGKSQLLLNTRSEKKNTADIWYDEKAKLLYVPTFFGNTVDVYKVN